MITIKAVTKAERVIEWNYDRPQQCSRLWRELTETGRAPDTGETLTKAYYYGAKCRPGDGPTKWWKA